MTRLRQRSVALGLSVLLAVIPSVVMAATPVAYSIVGAEYAATATTGSFAGIALAADDRAVWRATVDHSALPTAIGATAAVTGGTFALDGKARDAAGTFTGGQITLLTTSTCGRQTYAVAGTMSGQVTGTPSGTFVGGFDATLTHYRARIFSRCVTYAATVVGGVAMQVGT